MAERLPEIEDSDVSLNNLENELKIVKQRVEHVRQQVKGAFQEFTAKLIQRENELLAELDDIPTCIEVKIDECRDSLTQLKQHRTETEKDLQTNKLNQFLKNQLENIKLEIKRISTEDISFPHISLRLYMTPFVTGLKDACSIEKRTKVYANKMPVWSGVKRKGETELDAPYSICIDPVTQLIYISEFSDTQRIQVFVENGNYHSTLYNKEITHSRAIRLNKDYIYISSGLKMLKNAKILKLNKRGELIKSISIEQGIFGMAILADRIYTTSSGNTTVQIYYVNLKHKNTISLQAKSFDDEIIACDIIVRREDSIYVLFRGRLKCHSEFIQLFQLDGAFIRSISSEMVKQASNFCLDKYSNFIVSDWTSHCVNVYSEDGVLIHTIGEVMSKVAPLCLPRGVAVNASGRIVVVNAKADNMLQIY